MNWLAQSSSTVAASATRYGQWDTLRYLPETHHSPRSDFARDRARVLHSGAFRRLAAKTQVLSPTSDPDFARTRLTHSLEVAQVGRELASSLQLDPDVVDTACLAHDLGHPPFGHNGERALAEWSADIGGFEGNAQSLRVLTRLEPKVIDDQGISYGLNLTRASLDASCKYPWFAQNSVQDVSGREKFGVYSDDAAVFEWMREAVPDRVLCIEAQVMDFADDVAYSVHDLEDAVLNGHIDIRVLNSPAERETMLDVAARWVGDAYALDEIHEAFDRLRSLGYWLNEWDGARRDSARLKNLTSQLIGRFVSAATRATREASTTAELTRYGASLVIPADVRAEMATLKGIVAAYVMRSSARKPIYQRQRILLTELADALWQTGESHLERVFQDDWCRASDDAARRRVIVDQVASLTDQTAVEWHGQLCR